ncbi:UNVERIFIED_CONTAM: putative vacuolar protein sorting-associated protein [Sesamum radiatum]|uniref:Vacuolar protein sorting-associated protein n=1 Tax=Sesamum radiatum TaxID=300843 RepID=A0AAW2USH0_SESRA
MGSAKALAKELVRSRKTVNRLYENKAQLNSISMHLGESVVLPLSFAEIQEEFSNMNSYFICSLTSFGVGKSFCLELLEYLAIARTVGHLSKSAEVMKIVNNLMKAPRSSCHHARIQ